MYQYSHRVIALALVLLIAIAPSTFAENRSGGGTTSDLERLAADLESVFGRGSVEIQRVPRQQRSATRRDTTRPAAPTVMRTSSVDAIVEAMNSERASKGLRPLRLNATLSAAAADRVEDMLSKRYFAHVSPDGTQPFVWAKRRGYDYRTIGENLAVGYGGAAVVRGWMNSPGHRANILGRAFDEVGVAIANAAPLRNYSGPTVVALYAAAK